MNLEYPRPIDPILIAEDNPNDAMLLQMVFQRARILNPLQIVHDGEQALQYLRAEGVYADRKTYAYPILCLLDLKMPRKGGMDVLRWLRENPSTQSVPVVVTAGKGEMREVNCAYSLGARSFLVKPLTWLDVMEVLSCFRELRLAARGDKYVLEPVQSAPSKPVSQKPALLNYKPQPLDTSRLRLTDDILRLTELLAENNHEVWARDRMAQGWTYGPRRDDARKEHPCLVPYRDLPESEKLLDRNVALETIKTIFSFGLPHPVLEKATDTVRSEVIEKTSAALKNENLLPEQLRVLWEEHNAVVWAQSIELYRRGTSAALQVGEAFLALEIAAEGLKKYQNDLWLRQMQALALVRTGSVGSAYEILEQLRSSGAQDEETLTLLAGTYKDLWACAPDAGSRRRHLKMSFELYSEIYRRRPTYFSGIHAAATGLLYGEKESAGRIAREVEQLCRQTLQHISEDSEKRFWTRSALAESLLIQNDLAGAEEHYRAASSAAGQSWRVINRIRTQARLLLERMGRSSNQLDDCFKLPRIVVCSGLMFDKPEQVQMRFPFGLEVRVREELRCKLEEMDARIGFSSLACGTDMLFAETILERGGELHVVLPYNRQEFKKTNVEIIPDAKLGDRFDNILSRAASVTVLDECPGENNTIVTEYCDRLMAGQALLKGRQLGLDVLPLVAWDARSGTDCHETQNFVRLWETRQTPVEVIRLDKILEDLSRQDVFLWQKTAESSSAVEPFPIETEYPERVTKAVLFVDIVGHRLSRRQLPTFIQHFLTRASALLNALPKPPIVRHTWGNTIHCIFDELSEAGSFAVALQELIQQTDWTQVGLPDTLNVRITLHAGPVYPIVDPISGQMTFLGEHANQATHIEPIAEEGQIHATEAFAALSESQGVKEYVCDYVGQKQLPRRYGTVPVFLVRRRFLY